MKTRKELLRHRIIAIIMVIAIIVSPLPVMEAKNVKAAMSINDFINHPNWCNGASYSSGQTPKSGGAAGQGWGCNAYVRDYIYQVYGGTLYNCGTRFNNVDEIKSGDVVYATAGTMGVEHWFVVTGRNGNSLNVAEGNYDGVRANVQNNRYTLSGNQIQVKFKGGIIKYHLFSYGYHFSTPTPVEPSYKPDGYVDRVTSSAGRLEIWGWAFDRDSLSSAVPVHVYIDGPAGSGRLLCDGSANEARSDINKAFNVGGNHGYTINIPTKITGNHTLYVYAINIGKDGKPNNGENPLIGSKTVNIQGDNTAPVISDAKVIDKDSTGYTVQCKVTDNIGVNRVQCPTWTEKNDQDDIAKDWGTNASVKAKSMGNGVYQFRVNISDHNNEYGLYKTHIYAYDDCGNQTNSNLNHIEVVYMDISTRWDSLLPAGKDAFVGKAIIKTGDAKKYKTQKIITSVNKDGKMIEKVIDIPTDSSKADSWAGAFFVVDRRDFDNANGKYTTTYVVEEVNGNVWKKSMTYDFDEYPDDVKITLTKGEIYDLNMNSIIKSFFQNPPHGSKPILKKVMCYQSEGLSDGEVEIDLDNMALSGTKKGRVYLTLFNYGDNSSKDKIVIVDITDNESNDAEVPNVSTDSIANISGVTFTPSNDKISFRWIGVDDATGYELQSSLNSDLTDGKTVSWKNAKAVYNGGNWTGLKENTTYYFRIRAYKGDGEDRVYSDWTDIMTATTKKSEDVEDTPNKLDKVTNITYTALATQVNFKWTGVSDATGYQLQNSFNKDLSDSVIVSWNGAKYVYNGGNWTGLKEGTTYYFRIRAYKGDGDDRVYSDWTDVMTVTTQKATPVTNNTSATTPSTTEQKPSNYNYPSSTYDTISVPKIKLTKLKSKKKGQIAVSWDWEIVDGYQIWYSRDRDFYRYYSKRINWLKSGGTLKGLSKGKRYYVKVRGYKEDKYGDRVYGSWSNVKSIKVKK